MIIVVSDEFNQKNSSTKDEYLKQMEGNAYRKLQSQLFKF